MIERPITIYFHCPLTKDCDALFMTKLDYTRCPICNENNEELLMEPVNTHGSHWISEERFRLVTCRTCGLVYINPRPAAEEISNYYNSGYYASNNRCKSYFEGFLSRYFLSKRNKIISFKKEGGRILDVGCGSGDFIFSLSASNKQWDVYGVEPNMEGYNLGKLKVRGHIFNKELPDCKFPNNYFDVVTMWHSLEHIYDPQQLLKEINRILKNDGVLIVAIPNSKSIGFKVSKEFWFHLDAPRHLYHYNEATIEKLLNKNEFKITNIQFPFMEFPLDLYHSLINSLVKNQRMKIILMLPFLIISFPIKFIGSLLKSSETLIVTCKKE